MGTIYLLLFRMGAATEPEIAAPGLEYSIGRSRVDYRIGVASRLHYTTEPGRLHYTAEDEDQ